MRRGYIYIIYIYIFIYIKDFSITVVEMMCDLIV